ncbi:mandelate racemase/muconate lactonizing enzyme family protein [Cupriavidus metallidurans]|uniref:Mandelate racemase/muconate lactonizing enzyme n=1 Tax=Cupriavidus metallidurans (strain ATCC 43123 / DSM 2839 / NBRC 102507 / CH34) TaxID=266264 RepID=Q1LBZ4_CUPMC|nr:mandelate racemase/muconate lactonizing enzyme family protein [Cupriavidus metallidurans]ABF12332.1 mandelate racemase/muconate lactonizing enzyme [Cupriavidus metallidurans CH34]QGS32429.1 mandelate racemase [Cupriavidus metallidurans]
MRIVNIFHKPLRLQTNIANALVNFSEHTVSLVAMVSDQVRNGRPVVGYAFDSIGRYDQQGILGGRMIPRLLKTEPETLQDDDGRLSPAKVLRCAMQNEKPGGHGDRAHAAAALELAAWDLVAKLDDVPAAVAIARHCGREADARIGVYAAGGYYYPGEDVVGLRREIERHIAHGFDRFKIKIGGAPLGQDLERVQAAVDAARKIGQGARVAVDANGRFDIEQAVSYGNAMREFPLMWYEEPCDPLDYASNAELASHYKGALATGENLFSSQDVKNLVLFGGMRRDLDIFQMDSGLSYGVTGYLHMLHEMEERGFSRRFAFPHGGQLLALHVVAGLGLGGCEVYPDIFQPLGGFGDDTRVDAGAVALPSLPGFGFEGKAELWQELASLQS